MFYTLLLVLLMALLFGLGWLMLSKNGLIQNLIESRQAKVNALEDLVETLNARTAAMASEIAEMSTKQDSFTSQFKNRLTSLESTRGHDKKGLEKLIMAQQLQEAAKAAHYNQSFTGGE